MFKTCRNSKVTEETLETTEGEAKDGQTGTKHAAPLTSMVKKMFERHLRLSEELRRRGALVLDDLHLLLHLPATRHFGDGRHLRHRVARRGR